MENLYVGEDFVSRLIVLEEKLGHKVSYRILEPFPVIPSVVGIQNAARIVSEFLGMDHLVFVVNFATQKHGIGAHIELQNDSREVFVELSPGLKEFPESILATLAHELTHKYLFIHRIYKGFDEKDTLENELLTDIASVYLGLGKLQMNGCERTKTWEERTYNGRRINSETFTAGYLSRPQFAVAYLITCQMRGISEDTALNNLSSDARQVIRAQQQIHKHFFRSEFGSQDRRSKPKEELSPVLRQAEESLEGLRQLRTYIQDILDRYLDSFSVKTSRQLSSVKTALTSDDYLNTYNPSLRYLRDAMRDLQCDRDKRDLEHVLGDLHKHQRYITKIVRILDKSGRHFSEFPKPPAVEKTSYKKKSFLRFWR